MVLDFGEVRSGQVMRAFRSHKAASQAATGIMISDSEVANVT